MQFKKKFNKKYILITVKYYNLLYVMKKINSELQIIRVDCNNLCYTEFVVYKDQFKNDFSFLYYILTARTFNATDSSKELLKY